MLFYDLSQVTKQQVGELERLLSSDPRAPAVDPLTSVPVLFGSVFPPGSLQDGLLNLSGIWPGLLSGGEGTQEFTTVTAVRGRDMGGRQEGLGTELGLWAQPGT